MVQAGRRRRRAGLRHVVPGMGEDDRAGFTRRIEAFRKTHPDSNDAPFYVMTVSLDLIHDHKELIASIRAQLPLGVNPPVTFGSF